MNLLLVMGLAFGTDALPWDEMYQQTVQLPVGSEWVLDWGEWEGTAFNDGQLTLGWEGHGDLDFMSRFSYNLEYSLDFTGRPSHITLYLRDIWGLKWERKFGIYRVDGHRLMLCISWDGKHCPTDFMAKPNDGRVLLVFKRKR